jgi:hypothetical protein
MFCAVLVLRPVSWSGKNRAFALVSLLSAASALPALSTGSAGCGFDGTGKLASSGSPTEPGGSEGPAKAVDPPPSGNPPGVAPDGGGTSPTVPVSPCSDTTLAFDGVDDFATVPDDSDLDLDGDFTVEAWIRPGAKTTTGLEMDLVSHHDAQNSRGWVLLIKDGRVEIVVYGDEFGAKGYSAGNAGPTYVVPGQWAHVAGTLQGDTLRVYYGGVLRDTQDLGTFFGRSNYTGALRLGRAAYVEDFRYNGELDDIRLSKLARYTGATAPKPSGLLSLDDATEASWRFDEPSGPKLTDSTTRGHDGSVAPDATAPGRLASTCIADR